MLLRRAINEDVPVPENVRLAIVDELFAEFESASARRCISAARSVLAMEAANIRAEHAERKLGENLVD